MEEKRRVRLKEAIQEKQSNTERSKKEITVMVKEEKEQKESRKEAGIEGKLNLTQYGTAEEKKGIVNTNYHLNKIILTSSIND